ncbi:hypothetical protein [Streptomyces sp. NPDC051219]
MAVGRKLSHDNPYWRRRHPREAAREPLAVTAFLADGGELKELCRRE